jgi:glucose/arabinose dehydrogenase
VIDAPVVPPTPDAAPPPADLGPQPDVAANAYCALGSNVAGAVVPPGFCLRRYAGIEEARTLAIAPNGDLFVGAPSRATPGGAAGGPGAIIVLSDDDHDGVAELHTFAEGLADVHGLAVGPDALYFTTTNDVWRTPYTKGQRKETGPRQSLGMPQRFGTGGRWAHGLAMSPQMGTLYASRGEYSSCGPTAGGEISSVGMGFSQAVAKGMRNPMYLRCHYKDEVCAATELGEDQMPGAREKLIGLRPATDYGYPCCYTRDRQVAVAPAGSCGAVTQEDAEFVLSDTPFGMDWERDTWPAPYQGGLFVALHGSFYSRPVWRGARIVYARTDPTTHMPVEDWKDFLGGFGPDDPILDRPSDVVFGPDGRMFFSDDEGGAVFWVAPLTLPRPN